MASPLLVDGIPAVVGMSTSPHALEIASSPLLDDQRSGTPTASMKHDMPSSSISPPPSSQVPRRVATPFATTPEPTSLSSPPPTIANGIKYEASGSLPLPTKEQIDNASSEDLRGIIQNILAENLKLDINAREARMSAAHHKLQHNLLLIESEETMKRLEVEHDMTRREVEALQANGRDNDSYSYIIKLKGYCKELEEEASITRRRLNKAKQVIEDKDYKLSLATDEINRLRERIRQNREHIDNLRSPGGPLYVSTPRTTPNTPQHYRATPKQTPSSIRRREPPGSARPFEALLLADAVLSQENNSAPSTPVTARHRNIQTPNRHQRGAQSLSSLHHTPRDMRRLQPGLLPAPQFSPESEARVAQIHGWNAARGSAQRRRLSRDSTISADDMEHINEERAGHKRSFREDSEEINESQASQSATEMLRADPRESFEISASRTHTPNLGSDNLQQSKIYGAVTKSVGQKRRRGSEDEAQISAKKLRAAAGAAIGLGLTLEGLGR